ncbi:MAG: HD domain-containing phosphohydrolase [Acidimicrobiia bacterium]
MNKQQIDRRTAFLAAASAGAGAVVVVALFVFQSDPSPLWLWATLAAAFVTLEFSSVEVNDRLFVSSSIMVAFTGIVVFDRDSAVLAVTLMAAAAVLHPEDLRLRRWRQPAYNFGQLVLSTAIGALVLFPFLPDEALAAEDLPILVGGAALASIVYNWVNFRLVAIYVKVAYPDRSLRPWSRMFGNHLVHAVLGAYGALLGAAYVMVGPVALPLMFGTFLVGHSGFATYSRMRQAHEDTVSGFVKAIEALDPYTKGHTDRVAQFCRMTGEQLGLDADQLEVLRWSALIHDVGKLAAPAELINREGPLTEEEQARLGRRMAVVEELLSRVDFLAAAVEASAASRESQDTQLIGRVLGAADAFDAMTTTRSYRSAVTQTAAFDQLRRDDGLHGSDVVEALIAAIVASDVVYGAPDAGVATEVERLVQERIRRG